jgi:hypothetical protein
MGPGEMFYLYELKYMSTENILTTTKAAGKSQKWNPEILDFGHVCTKFYNNQILL